MSHIRKVTLKVRDLDALEAAADACGMDLQRGEKTFKWYGRFVGDSPGIKGMDPKDYGKCSHRLRLRGATDSDYDVGVVPAADGDGFELHVDDWGQSRRLLPAIGGANMDKLRREYAASRAATKAKKKLVPKGFVVKRTELANGGILLRAVRR
jgi:hypothetical protein